MFKSNKLAILAALLSLLMLFSAFAVPAFAEDVTTSEETTVAETVAATEPESSAATEAGTSAESSTEKGTEASTKEETTTEDKAAAEEKKQQRTRGFINLGVGGRIGFLSESGDSRQGQDHQERQQSGQDSQLFALKHAQSSQSRRLFVKSVLAAEFAVLLELQSVRVVLLVLHCVVVSLLALGAYQSYLDSYFISHDIGTSHKNYLQSHGSETAVYLPLREPVSGLWRKFRTQQKSSSQR